MSEETKNQTPSTQPNEQDTQPETVETAAAQEEQSEEQSVIPEEHVSLVEPTEDPGETPPENGSEPGDPAAEGPTGDEAESPPRETADAAPVESAVVSRDEDRPSEDSLFTEEFSYSPEEYKELEALYNDTFRDNEENSITEGRVVNITDRDVAVDIGFKSEGWVPLEEFDDPTNLKIGDTIEVFIEKFEGPNGALLLSKKRADVERTWMRLKNLESEGAVIEGKVIRRIKGGLVVDLMGIDAFLPGSQIDIHPVRDFDSLIGKKMDFRIVKINDARKNIVVSRKVLIEEDMREIRERVLSELEVGQIREGVVKNITNFGVFVDLGGVDGLLHITDLSWGRVNHPSDVVKLDQKITVKVLSFDRERNRISIGLKQLQPHPWNDVDERFPVNTRVAGKVVSLTRYGAFVELAEGIEGLIHISEMSWTQHVKHPSQILSVGQQVEVMVLEVRKEERKISLGLKQTEPNPWEELADKYTQGSIHEGLVRDLVPFGVFVELEAGIEGLVHISDLSWTRKLRHPGELVKKDETLKVQVLQFDRDERRIALGVKQLQENPWEKFEEEFDVGSQVECKVAKVIDKGVVVTLPHGLEGFVPNSKMRLTDAQGNKVQLKEGDGSIFRIIEYDRNNKKVILATPQRVSEEQKAVLDYRKSKPKAHASGALGDALREAGLVKSGRRKSQKQGEGSREARAKREAPQPAPADAEAGPKSETEPAPPKDTDAETAAAPEAEAAPSADSTPEESAPVEAEAPRSETEEPTRSAEETDEHSQTPEGTEEAPAVEEAAEAAPEEQDRPAGDAGETGAAPEPEETAAANGPEADSGVADEEAGAEEEQRSE